MGTSKNRVMNDDVFTGVTTTGNPPSQAYIHFGVVNETGNPDTKVYGTIWYHTVLSEPKTVASS